MNYIKNFKEFVNPLYELKATNIRQLHKKSNDKVKKYLNLLSDDELTKKWIDYSKIIKRCNRSNPLTLYMRIHVNEGLICTYPIEKTIEYVSSYFNLTSTDIYSENNIIMVCIPVIYDNLKLIEKAMSLCGYFLSYPKKDKIEDGLYNWLQFEPRFQEDESKKIRKSEHMLIHLTPYYNLKNIKKIGFSPRCKNTLFNYPSRLYFLKGSLNKQEIENIGYQLCKENNSIGNKNKKYVLITLDLKKIPNDTKMYSDLNYPYGIFITDNISPDVIKNIEIIYF